MGERAAQLLDFGRANLRQALFQAARVGAAGRVPEEGAIRGELERLGAAILGVWRLDDEVALEEVAEQRGDGGLADDERLHEVGLGHGLVMAEEVEDVELRDAEAVRLEEAITLKLEAAGGAENLEGVVFLRDGWERGLVHS